MHLLVDSTGIKFLGDGEWQARKQGPQGRRQWRKVHPDMDAATSDIRAVEFTPTHRYAVVRSRLGRSGARVVQTRMAAPEKTGGRLGRPSCGASQAISSTRISSEPRSRSATL